MASWKTVTSWNYIGTGKEMKENVYWLFYARIKIVKLFVPKQDDVFVMLANVWHKIILLTSRLENYWNWRAEFSSTITLLANLCTSYFNL